MKQIYKFLCYLIDQVVDEGLLPVKVLMVVRLRIFFNTQIFITAHPLTWGA